MSILKSIGLLAGGVAAGYIASRIQTSAPSTSQEVSPSQSAKSMEYSGKGQIMAQFFDSPIGQRIQPLAMKTVGFAARVKQGMDERETQLKSKFEEQKLDPRPGEVKGWDAIDSSTIDVDTNAAPGTHSRIQRDKELGEDFFA